LQYRKRIREKILVAIVGSKHDGIGGYPASGCKRIVYCPQRNDFEFLQKPLNLLIENTGTDRPGSAMFGKSVVNENTRHISGNHFCNLVRAHPFSYLGQSNVIKLKSHLSLVSALY